MAGCADASPSLSSIPPRTCSELCQLCPPSRACQEYPVHQWHRWCGWSRVWIQPCMAPWMENACGVCEWLTWACCAWNALCFPACNGHQVWMFCASVSVAMCVLYGLVNAQSFGHGLACMPLHVMLGLQGVNNVIFLTVRTDPWVT